ncbi:MAG: hypothetical protein ABI900_05575 [Betaproteobacteria bacterium]
MTARLVTGALAAIALAVGIAACSRAPDKSAAAKPELVPTPPAIGAPPAEPAPVMPPKASTVFDSSAVANSAPPAAASGDKAPSADETAKGSDPTAKEPLSKGEESTAMPKPGQANDHSTVATDGKQ